MINIAEHDKDFLRFLWVDDINSDDPSLVFYRFCRVVFGLCSSPFLLNGTLHYHLKNYFLENPELLKILLKSFYVDDFVSGKDTKPETLDLCLQIRECSAEAGFSLHKWVCSDPEITKLLNEKAQGVHSPRLYTGISIRENGKKPKSIKLFCLLPKSIIIFNGENPEISQNCQKTKVIY